MNSMLAIRASRAFDGERFLTGGVTVLVDDGRIVDVEEGFPDVGVDRHIIEHPAGTIHPGLIDTHAHLAADSAQGALDRIAGYTDDELDAVISDGLRRQLDAGVTTVRDLGDRRFAVLDRRDRQRAGAARVPEPTILASGPPLTSPNGHCHYLGGVVADRSQIERAIDERAARGVDVVKVMASGGMTTAGTDVLNPQFTAADLRFVVDRAHQAGLPVTAHAHALSAVIDAVQAGVDGIEHCSCLTETGIHLSDEVIEAIADRGIVIGGVIPVPQSMDLSLAPPKVRELIYRQGAGVEQVRAVRMQMLDRLHRGGVQLVTGPDSGISAMVAHGKLAELIEFLAEAGLSPAASLAAATSQAAQACGVGSRKGMLRRGYDADLVVVDGDPSTDPGALCNVRSVVLGGTVVRG